MAIWNTLSHVDYITVYLKKLVSNLFHHGSALVETECMKRKTRLAIGRAPKHYNSIETFPYAIQKHLVMHQSNFTLKKPI